MEIYIYVYVYIDICLSLSFSVRLILLALQGRRHPTALCGSERHSLRLSFGILWGLRGLALPNHTQILLPFVLTEKDVYVSASSGKARNYLQ